MEIWFVLTGVIAGILAGLFGVGGGLLIVPALFFLLPYQGIPADILMHMAIGTSLATIVVTSISSAWSHYRRQAVLIPVLLSLVPGLLLGAFLAGQVADQLRSTWLTLLFAVFEIFVAIQMMLALKVDPHRELPGAGANLAVGSGIGLVSGLVGIGGGTLTVPYLSWCNVPIKKAIGTSAACGLPIAIAGAIGFMVAGAGIKNPPAWSTGYVLWPAFLYISLGSVLFAPVGAWIAHRMNSAALKKLFALFLGLLGIRMILKLAGW